jgi:hypothetical protein
MIRELKCPYGDDFEGGDECDRCEQYELCMESYTPTNLIEIPNDASNYDVLKAVFGNISAFRIKDSMEFEKGFELWFSKPYKRGNENE